MANDRGQRYQRGRGKPLKSLPKQKSQKVHKIQFPQDVLRVRGKKTAKKGSKRGGRGGYGAGG